MATISSPYLARMNSLLDLVTTGLQCVVKVGIPDLSFVSIRCFDMWGYAVAIESMCVRHE